MVPPINPAAYLGLNALDFNLSCAKKFLNSGDSGRHRPYVRPGVMSRYRCGDGFGLRAMRGHLRLSEKGIAQPTMATVD